MRSQRVKRVKRSKKSKMLKRKQINRRTKRVKRSKRTQINRITKRSRKSQINRKTRRTRRTRRNRRMGGGAVTLPDITFYRIINDDSAGKKEISLEDLITMNQSSNGGWEEPTTINKIRNYYSRQRGVTECKVSIKINKRKEYINDTTHKDSYNKLADISLTELKYWKQLAPVIVLFNISIHDPELEAELEAEYAKLLAEQ